MNNILWYQSANLLDQDVVIYNGKTLDVGLERTEAFSKLKKISEKVIGKKRPWCGKVDNYFFVKGSFEAKDERGRNLIFLFVSDALDGKQALVNTLQSSGQQMTQKTQNSLNTSNKHWKEVAICVLIVAGIIAMVVYAIKGCD